MDGNTYDGNREARSTMRRIALWAGVYSVIVLSGALALATLL
jgi:hypothetical protein